MKPPLKDLVHDVFWQVLGLLLAVVVFAVGYWLLPNGSDGSPRIAPAFLLSIIALLIGHSISMFRLFHSTREELKTTQHQIEQLMISNSVELKDYLVESSNNVKAHLDATGTDVRRHLHLVSLGSPEEALDYVKSRLSSIKFVRNTSFNTPDEVDEAEEKLYRRDGYQDLLLQIAKYVQEGLSWRDVGDADAKSRFETIQRELTRLGSSTSGNGAYISRQLLHSVPQMNFMILNYTNKNYKEVLFNWDYRQGDGGEPAVLATSLDPLVQMFSVQFELLWKAASPPHDLVLDLASSETKSTS